MPNFPVPQETVEAGLLAAIDRDLGRYLALEKTGVRAEDFVIHRQIFLFMQQYLQDYGSLPANSQISSRFGWQPPVGDFGYWLVEMRRYALASKVLQATKEIYDLSDDPDKALSLALERFSLIRAATSNHVQASDSTAQERYEKYIARQQYLYNTNNVIGIKTGIEAIDQSKIGWLPGELIGIYARPGVGKTWWMLWQGAIAWAQGLKVLAISPEMPANWLDIRIDVMLGSMMGVSLDYTKILAGDPSIQAEYYKVAEAVSQENRWWTYDSLNDRPISLGDLSGLIRLHKPDIALVDGISLLRYDGRGQTWEMMKENSYGAKHLCTINEIPMIVTHQPSNTARGIRKEVANVARGDDFYMPTLNDAAYGDAFVQACRTIFTMAADKDARYVQWYSIRKPGERALPKNLPARLGMGWDPAVGRIIDLGRYGHNPELVGQEARRLLGYDVIR